MEGDEESGIFEADGDVNTNATPQRAIVRLPEDVVNRIAAGEIIHRPANALKEMIENSLDAGAKMIRIQLRDGGLKMLQVQDDGNGVAYNDLPLLCQRFATSKLRTFSDLQNMTTFGFRGEALASISYVSANMNVVSRTKDSEIAYKASYANGTLVPVKPGQSSDPKPCAGSQGTFITAEDLFFNVPQRKRALKSASDEYAMALDVVSKYAVHYGGRGVGFSCKKAASAMVDLSVPSSSSTTTLDAIGVVYGSKVSKELIELQQFNNSAYGTQLRGYISSPNWNARRSVFLLFINNRLVDSPALRRAVLALYANILPKGYHPWVYLDLHIEESNVDVNVHPTKREVHFLHEEDIIEEICTKMQDALTMANNTRTFAMTQSVLRNFDQDRVMEPTSSVRPSYPQHLVRVDARAQTLDGMGAVTRQNEKQQSSEADIVHPEMSTPMPATAVQQSYAVKQSRTELESIEDLRKSIHKDRSVDCTEILRSLTFVGVADAHRQLLLAQHSTKLYLIQMASLIEEIAFQLLLQQFGELPLIRLQPAPLVQDLVRAALLAESEKSNAARRAANVSDEKVIETVQDRLKAHAEMLMDYFSIEVRAEEDGCMRLISLPNIFGHLGNTSGKSEIALQLTKIPSLLLRVAMQPDYTEEKACLQAILQELAWAHVPQQLQENRSDQSTQKQAIKHNWLRFWSTALKTYVPSRKLAKQGAVLAITNLPSLYSTFERC
ncbi:DNA mismatch repair protein MutL [Meira miltonrushii]|uniref:DNA mismatch repair protein MutL n=1 Tax=Meira miltonrushii TaxID=1280837 RepID=A0A316V4T9_9BASI|nr:DNA mismatch repair protein MutL [Meira miltonrushii]PWN32472.1 DNA mismatch repair protein MutL [Meira miltonrushii]